MRAVAPITVSAIVAAAVTPLFFDRVSPYSVTVALLIGVSSLLCCIECAQLYCNCVHALAFADCRLGKRNNDLVCCYWLHSVIGMLVPEAVGWEPVSE